MTGYVFWNGAEVSPYGSRRFRESVFPSNRNPNSSEISRSNQLAFGKSAVKDLGLGAPGPGKKSTEGGGE